MVTTRRSLADRSNQVGKGSVTQLQPIAEPVCAGSIPTIRAFIRNNGSTDSGTFNIRWEVDGSVFLGGHFSIAPGATDTHDHIWSSGPGNGPTPISAGSHTIRFTADFDNSVAETDEANNAKQITIVVADCGGGVKFGYPLTGGPPAPSYATYGVANGGLLARPTCFGRDGHLFNQLSHAGEDWFRPPGTAVHPIAAGKIVNVLPTWDHRAAIVVEHDLGVTQPWGTSRVYSAYLHLRNPLPVGSVVDRNTVLARVNNYVDAGRDNSHLHWEVRIYPSMTLSPLPARCRSDIGPSYTDTGTDPSRFGYLNPSAWVQAHS